MVNTASAVNSRVPVHPESADGQSDTSKPLASDRTSSGNTAAGSDKSQNAAVQHTAASDKLAARTTIDPSSPEDTVPPPKDPVAVPRSADAPPELVPPKVNISDMDLLMEILIRAGSSILKEGTLASLKDRAQERDAANAKNLEAIKKNSEALKNKGWLDVLGKVFKAVGAVVGVLAAAALIATGGGVFVVAGALAMLAAGSSLISSASDGKYSIAAGVAYIAEQCGASPDTAQWIGLAVEIGIALVSAALSCGGTLVSKSAAAAFDAAKAAQGGLKTLLQTITRYTDAAVKVGTGTTQAFQTYKSYQLSTIKISQKEIAAMLQKLQELMSVEQDFFEVLVKRESEIREAVSTIIKDSNQAQAKILSGGHQAMA